MCVLGSELPPTGGKVVGGEDLAPPAAHAPHRVQRDVVQVREDHQQHLPMKKTSVVDSVADPDPNPDPHVFGPTGSGSTSWRYGSGSFYHHAKIVRSKKNLDSYYFVTLFDFLSLKYDVNVPSKSNKQKKLC